LAAIIPEEKIKEVRNAADIYEIVSESVVLKKTGKNYQGLCPFHSEKTPSFSVNPSKQIFYCFGCGTGGDAIDFLMKKEGMSFPEAVRDLARRTGIHIPEGQVSPEQKKRLDEREKLMKVNRLAKEFYQGKLNGPDGEAARKYLENRGMAAETIDTFQIGYAPDGWDHLAIFFRNRRYPVPPVMAQKVGLIAPRKNGNGHYDSFRNRIVFPILNMSRQVIGFGGRVMDDAMPKYLNTPETPIYHKGRSLYGIDQAKQPAREKELVYIVEGYLDLIAMHQQGIRNSVATLGTALTSEHARMIRGLVGKQGRVVLVFDSDNAGVKAAERSIEVFDKEYMDAYILVLEEGHDPDSFLNKYGVERFRTDAQKAMSAISFLITNSVKRHGRTPEGKIRIITDLKKPIADLDDPVAQALYIRTLSDLIGIDENAVKEKIEGEKSGIGNAGRTSVKDPIKTGDIKNQQTSHRTRMESRIVSMMFQVPSMIEEVGKRGLMGLFENKKLRSIGMALIEKNTGMDGGATLLSHIEHDELRSMAASLAVSDEILDEKGCMKLIQQFESGRKRSDRSLLNDIKAAEAADDPEALDRLLREKMAQARQKTMSRKQRRLQ
jgi:DNA primase